MYYTTLNAICEQGPCTGGWKKLIAYLGKSKADDEPLSLATILEANGIEHALWALRAVEGIDDLRRLFAVRCVREHCQHFITDKECLDALDVAELISVGEASDDELDIAESAIGETLDEAISVERYATFRAARGSVWRAYTFAIGSAIRHAIITNCEDGLIAVEASALGTIEADFKAIFFED